MAVVFPMWGEALRHTLGINCHVNWAGNNVDDPSTEPEYDGEIYGWWEAWTDLMIDLRVPYHRGKALNTADGHATHQAMFKLRDNGIRCHAGIYNATWNTTTQANINTYWATIGRNLDCYVSVGGPNEPNQTTNWVTLIQTHMQNMWNARANYNSTYPGLINIPIAAPSLHDSNTHITEDWETMAATGIHQWIDWGDMHRYPSGTSHPDDPTVPAGNPLRTPSFLLDYRINGGLDKNGVLRKGMREAWGGTGNPKSTWLATEGGFNTFTNDPNTTLGGMHCDVDTFAEYTVRLWFEHVLLGTKRFFQYELLDDPDPTGNQAGVTEESHRGLVYVDRNNTWSNHPNFWDPHAGYYKVKGVIDLIYDQGGGYNYDTNPYTPPSIDLTLTGNITNPDNRFRKIVVGKRDGSVLMFYWIDKNMWTIPNGPPITVSSVSGSWSVAGGASGNITADGTVKSVLLKSAGGTSVIVPAGTVQSLVAVPVPTITAVHEPLTRPTVVQNFRITMS